MATPPIVVDDPRQLTDASLMRQVQSGRTHLFAELIRRYQPAMLRVARSRLRRTDLAEDAVQETFLAAFKSRHTYQTQLNFRTWIWTILLNHCRRSYARQVRVPETSAWTAHDDTQPYPVQETSCEQPQPLDQLLAQERQQLLSSLLDKLPPNQADALRLRFFAGLKFQEIADTMGCSLGTAKNRVQGGLLKLSEILNEEASFRTLAEEWRPLERDAGE